MSLEQFLDYFLKCGNKFDQKVLEEYENLFNNTIDLVYETLGKDAFNLYRERNNEWNYYNRPTKVLYDPIMYVFSQNIEYKEVLISKKEEIKADLPKFYMKEYESFGGRNTGKSHVEDRIKKVNSFISSYIGVE